MKPRVLWIEDSARFELNNLTGPIYFYGTYDFQQAENVTSAIEFLKVKEYDALIVDVRLPPGNDPYWRELYRKEEGDGGGEKLGIKLLYWLLAQEGSYSHTPPSWASPEKIAIFTVENQMEVRDDLDKLGINLFKQKTTGLADTTLLDLIKELLGRKKIK
jgi:hypothetical protein